MAKILEFIPPKVARSVSNFWNEIIISQGRLGIALYDFSNEREFRSFLGQVNPKLTKRVEFFDHNFNISYHIMDKFYSTINRMKIGCDETDIFLDLHGVLQNPNNLPNLKTLFMNICFSNFSPADDEKVPIIATSRRNLTWLRLNFLTDDEYYLACFQNLVSSAGRLEKTGNPH